LSALARRHTLIRYDLRGCGLSDREGVEFSFDKLVEDLEVVIEAAGVERFALFGMTGCARIAMSYLLRHPDMVSWLVLYGASACGPLARNPPREQLEETRTRLKRWNWAGRRKPRATVNSLHRCTYSTGVPLHLRRIWPSQTFLYVGGDKDISIVDRKSMMIVGTITDPASVAATTWPPTLRATSTWRQLAKECHGSFTKACRQAAKAHAMTCGACRR
jgi:pimeloyl-ACP methyl ester carboxylesterase